MFSNSLAMDSAAKNYFTATIREVVLPNQKKDDGTWNVKIRVTHKRKTNYISTQHFVGPKQIRTDNTVKDPIVLKSINPVLDEYRTMISDLGAKLDLYDLNELINYLTKKGVVTADDINIIAFGRTQIEKLKKDKRDASAADMQKVVNSLVDYCKTEVIPITTIRAKFLESYEAFLKSPRSQTRLNQFKRPVTRIVKGLGKTGLHNHMRDLRILFNDIVEFYNDDDMGIVIVKHYPFKKYKIVKAAKNNKKKLSVAQVRTIMNCNVPTSGRIEQAKELAMLSFYLCGMNAVDLHKLELPGKVLKPRIDYNRSKTKSRRDDEAFMSVKIPPIAVPLYLKYAGTLQNRYSTHITLDQALSKGMKGLAKLTGIVGLEFYDLRHAFADIARNSLGFHKDDVGDALNHKDSSVDVTDNYLARSWGIIDEVQGTVIDFLIGKVKKLKARRQLAA
jgi:integrase